MRINSWYIVLVFLSLLGSCRDGSEREIVIAGRVVSGSNIEIGLADIEVSITGIKEKALCLDDCEVKLTSDQVVTDESGYFSKTILLNPEVQYFELFPELLNDGEPKRCVVYSSTISRNGTSNALITVSCE